MSGWLRRGLTGLLAARAAIGEEGLLVRFVREDLDVLVAAGIVAVCEGAVLVHVLGAPFGLLRVVDDYFAFRLLAGGGDFDLQVELVVLDRVGVHGSVFGLDREPGFEHHVDHAHEFHFGLDLDAVDIDLDAVELHLGERAFGRRHRGDLGERRDLERHALRHEDLVAHALHAVHSGLRGLVLRFPHRGAERHDQGFHRIVLLHLVTPGKECV